MSKTVIEVEKLSKLYRLGTIGAGTLKDSLGEWWRKLRHPHQKPVHRFKIPAGREGPTANTLWALRDVSFNIQSGDSVAVIGRNGAGKSTLLKLLSRITEPTEGRAILRGRMTSLLEVGTGFHPELTGRDNIYLNGTILGMRRQEIHRKLQSIVDFSEIGPYLDTPVKRYSSGMTVRLAFAVAAHLEPQILILDEVLAVGDLAFQAKCIRKIRELTGKGITILFVSHNLYLLQTLCQRAIVLNDGRLIADTDINQGVALYKKAMDPIGNEGTKHAIHQSSDLCLRKWTFNGSEEKVLTVNGPTPLTVEWEIEAARELKCYYGFSILSAEGNYITGLSSFLENKPFILKPGVQRGGIHLPNVDLPSGSYHLGFSIMDETGIPTFLNARHAGVLSVERNFEYDGLVGIPHNWLHTPSVS